MRGAVKGNNPNMIWRIEKEWRREANGRVGGGFCGRHGGREEARMRTAVGMAVMPAATTART